MTVKIESGIPIPESTRHGRGSIYPWAQLKPGQSFLHQGSKKSAYSSVAQARKRLGKDFIVRSMKDGVRIWLAPKTRKTKV